MTLQIGDPAPTFTLPDQNGTSVSLADLRGTRVVLYFYPKDDTPGCTKEACGFRDQWASFEQHGIKVLGISKDEAGSHTKFIAKYQLPFTLLSDPEPCEVAAAYDSYGLKKFMGREFMGVLRSTFIIGKDGKLKHVMDKVKTKSHHDDVLALIKELGL